MHYSKGLNHNRAANDDNDNKEAHDNYVALDDCQTVYHLAAGLLRGAFLWRRSRVELCLAKVRGRADDDDDSGANDYLNSLQHHHESDDNLSVDRIVDVTWRISVQDGHWHQRG